MRHSLISLCLSLLLLTCLSACKKAEQPSPPKTDSGKVETQPSPAEPAKPQASAPAALTPTGEAVLIKVKWPVGNRYVYRMDFDQHSTNKVPQMPKPIQQDLNLAMTYAMAVLKEIPEGGSEIELEFLANEMEIKMGGQTMMSFDSKESSKNDGQNPFAGPFRKMVGSKVHLIMGADGKVDKIIGYQEWVNNVQGDAGGPAAGMISQQFNEGFIRQIAGFGLGLPDKPVRIGESWPFQMEVPAGPLGKITIDSKVSFKGWEVHEQHKCAALSFAGTLAGTPGQEAGPMGKMSIDGGTVSGVSWFDPKAGALIESSQDQSMRLKGEVNQGGAPGGITYSIELGQKVTVKLVELGKTNP